MTLYQTDPRRSLTPGLARECQFLPVENEKLDPYSQITG